MHALVLWMVLFGGVDESMRILRAREYVQHAQAHFRRGEYMDAIGDFELAFGEVPRPEFRFNVALCYAELEYWGHAALALAEYLMTPGMRPSVAAEAAKLAKAIEEGRASRPAPGPRTIGWNHLEHDRKYSEEHVVCEVRKLFKSGAGTPHAPVPSPSPVP